MGGVRGAVTSGRGIRSGWSYEVGVAGLGKVLGQKGFSLFEHQTPVEVLCAARGPHPRSAPASRTARGDDSTPPFEGWAAPAQSPPTATPNAVPSAVRSNRPSGEKECLAESMAEVRALLRRMMSQPLPTHPTHASPNVGRRGKHRPSKSRFLRGLRSAGPRGEEAPHLLSCLVPPQASRRPSVG